MSKLPAPISVPGFSLMDIAEPLDRGLSGSLGFFSMWERASGKRNLRSWQNHDCQSLLPSLLLSPVWWGRGDLCDGAGEMSLTDCMLGRKGRAVLSCGRGFPLTTKLALSCSQRGNGEEECYWKMFLIIAEIFSKCFFFSLNFFFSPCNIFWCWVQVIQHLNSLHLRWFTEGQVSWSNTLSAPNQSCDI